jgi:hypothetical protein
MGDPFSDLFEDVNLLEKCQKVLKRLAFFGFFPKLWMVAVEVLLYPGHWA